MSSSFSANQYDNSYKPYRLQNWTIPKHFKERPSAREGHTKIIATDRGHLFPGMKAKSGCQWTSFKGTWDLVDRVCPAHVNPTARSQEGMQRMTTWHTHRCTTHSHQNSSRAVSRTLSEKAAVNPQCAEPQIPVNAPAPDGPEPQSRPGTQQSHAEIQAAYEENQAESRPVTRQKQDGCTSPVQDSLPQSRPGSHLRTPLNEQADVIIE